MNLNRRSFLVSGASALALLGVAAAWPVRALAKLVRPEAAFTATTVDDALAGIGGTAETSAEIVFQTPEIAENGAVVPVSVTSNIPGTDQISILVEANPNPLVAVFSIPEGTLPSVMTRVKVAQTCNLTAVVRANGKNYSVSRETKVTLGGCGG